jgi:hypothetical protein
MKGKSSYGIYTIFLLVIVFIGLVVWGKLPFLDPVRSFLGLETKITSGEVVEKIRAASYLTTTKYTIQVVAKSETPGFLIFGWAKMLIIAKGTVEAGIDLNQLAAKGVRRW